MEPKIVEMGPSILVGIYGDNANGGFSAIRELFVPRMDSIPDAVSSGRNLGVELYPEGCS